MAGGLPIPANQTFPSFRDEAPATRIRRAVRRQSAPALRVSPALRRERTAAAATAGRLRILEDEPSPHQVFLIIERGFVEVEKALGVHKQPRAVFLDDFVAVPRLRFETHRVRQARTATPLHANAQASSFHRNAFLGEQLLNLGCRFFRYVNH